MHMNRVGRFLLLSLLAGVCLAASLWLTQPALQASVTDTAGHASQVSLPWSFEGQPDLREINVHLHDRIGTNKSWHIIPDDRLLSVIVNGQVVPLNQFSGQQLSDWSNGVLIDLGHWLKIGDNDIVIQVENHGGQGGINMRPEISGIRMLPYFLGFLLLLSALQQIMPLSGGQRCIMLLGLVVLLAYWSITPWQLRTHDVGLDGGHFGYVTWIADRLSLPRPTDGWTYYHPPLYYIISAAILRGADIFSISRPEALQIFSLSLWLLFLSASAASLRVCLRGKESWLLVATTALVLWPSGIIHSIRIGNDVPTYACSALAALCMLRWWKTRYLRALFGMAIWTALALACKTSSIALVATGCVLLGWKLVLPGRLGRLQAFGHTAVFGMGIVAGLTLGLAGNIYHYWRGEVSHWLVGNVGSLADGLRVPVNLKAFLPLDIPTFLVTPWINPWEDASGRGNFWNYLLRNSLSGEFSFNGKAQYLISMIWGIALLTLSVLVVREVCRTLAQQAGASTAYRLRPLLLLGFFWLASLIALRIQAPYACSNDFRYIVPVLLPAIVLAVRAGHLARFLLVAIGLLSAYFFASL
jgi:hypothetical protein